MIIDTSGFYKYESEQLSYGKWVLNIDFELYSDKKNEYSLPIDGWYWFDTIDDAKIFFGVPEKEELDIGIPKISIKKPIRGGEL